VRPSLDYAERQMATMARERDGYRCAAQIPDVCAGTADHVHHRVQRSLGGDDALDNLLTVCFACHDWIHTNVALALARGWLRRSTDA